MIRSLLMVSVLAAASAASSARPLLAAELKVKTVWVPVGIGRPTTWVQVRRGPGLANGEACTARIECASGLCGAGTCADPALRVTCYPDADSDGYGATEAGTTRYDGVCPAATVQTSGDCDDAIATTHPGATDLCNGVDDNCDGIIDEGFPTKGTDCQDGVGECEQFGTFVCSDDGSTVLCDAQALLPLSIEYCNNRDDDCDGEVDEEYVGAGEPCIVGLGVCEDTGTYTCESNLQTVTCSAQAGVPEVEISGNGLDDDCDGLVDETPGNTDSDGSIPHVGVSVTCTRDLTELAALSACPPSGATADGVLCECSSSLPQCPCGSHCSLGRCSYSCLEDDDCPADRTCSFSGRCETPGEVSVTPSGTTAPVIWPSFVELSNPGQEHLVRISAWNGDVGGVRIVVTREPSLGSEQGSRVDDLPSNAAVVVLGCGSKMTPTATECFIDNLPRDTTYELYLQSYSLPQAEDEPEDVFIKVYYGDSVDTVVARVLPQGSPPGVSPDGTLVGSDTTIGGSYHGTLTLLGIQSLDVGSVPATDQVRHNLSHGVELPISATYNDGPTDVHGDATGTLTLEDAVGTFGLFPATLCVTSDADGTKIYACDGMTKNADIAFADGVISGTLGLTLPWPSALDTQVTEEFVVHLHIALRPVGENKVDRDEFDTSNMEPVKRPMEWGFFVREWIADLSTVREDGVFGAGDYVATWYENTGRRQSTVQCKDDSEEATDYSWKWHFDSGSSLFPCEAARHGGFASTQQACDGYWENPSSYYTGMVRTYLDGQCYVEYTRPHISRRNCAEAYLCYEPIRTEVLDPKDTIPYYAKCSQTRDLLDLMELTTGEFDRSSSKPMAQCMHEGSLIYVEESVSVARSWDVSVNPLQSAVDDQESWETSLMLDSCIAELSRVAPFREPPQPRHDGKEPQCADESRTAHAAFGDVFLQEPRCLDLARFMPALYWASHGEPDCPDWNVSPEQVDCSVVTRRFDLVFGLLHQWLEQHAFLAIEGRQSIMLQRMLDLEPIDASHVLDLLESSWTVFSEIPIVGALDHYLTSDASRPLAEISNGRYLDTWYQGGIFLGNPTLFPADYPAFSLSAVILEGLTAHLEFLGDYLESAIYENPDERTRARQHARRGVDAALYMMALSDWIYARQVDALVLSADASLGDEISEALSANRSAVGESMSRVVRQADALAAGVDPYEGNESDVPVVFLDGAVTDWQKYTGASQTMLGDNGKATVAVRNVGLAEDEARFLWSSFQALTAQSSTREDDITNHYDDEIAGICGADASGESDGLDAWDTDGDGELDRSITECFLTTSASRCSFDATLLASRIRSEDADYSLCVATNVRLRYGPSVFDESPEFEELLAPVISAAEEWEEEWNDVKEAYSGFDSFLEYFDSELTDTIELIVTDDVRQIWDSDGVDQSGNTSALALSRLLVDMSWDSPWLEDVSTEHLIEARSACASMYPNASTRAIGVDDVGLGAAEKPDCYKGALGELALARYVAAKRVDTAVSAIQEKMDDYEIAVKSCKLQEDIGDALADLDDAFQDAMMALRREAARARGWAGALGSYGLSFRSARMDLEIADAEAAHAKQMQAVSAYGAVQTCLLEATSHLVGFNTAALDAEGAMIDGSVAELDFRNMADSLRRLVREGRARVKRAENTLNPTLRAHALWLDEAVTNELRAMRRARRMTFLALRAVEYDVVQGTLHECDNSRHGFPDCRSFIRGARNADQLADALTALQDRVSTATNPGYQRNIHGSAISSGVFVNISMKDRLLSLSSDDAFGGKELNREQRLRLLLLDPRFTYVDEWGNSYQRIPFSVLPITEKNLLDAGVSCLDDAGNACANNPMSVYAGDACGERLWKITVAMEPPAVFADPQNRNIPVTVLRNHAFSARDCGGGPGDFITTTYKPYLNPFLDPATGIVGATFDEQTSEPRPFTKQQVAACHLTEEKLNSAEAPNTSDDAFGGWGLYGDYALMVSWYTLQDTTRFRLENLEDIIIRLDYLHFTRQ